MGGYYSSIRIRTRSLYLFFTRTSFLSGWRNFVRIIKLHSKPGIAWILPIRIKKLQETSSQTKFQNVIKKNEDSGRSSAAVITRTAGVCECNIGASHRVFIKSVQKNDSSLSSFSLRVRRTRAFRPSLIPYWWIFYCALQQWRQPVWALQPLLHSEKNP